MHERRNIQRHRTLLGGKIVFNDRRSVIDCLVRNFSESGACLQVNNTVGIPAAFDLLVEGEEKSLSSRVIWTSENRIGIFFDTARLTQVHGPMAQKSSATPAPSGAGNGERQNNEVLRSEMLALRAALDEIPLGVVLLDTQTRAQFINRAFRRMWRLPDAKADSKPPFVALV